MQIQTSELQSTTPDGTTLKSYVCSPNNSLATKLPAILVAPEWWGVSEHPKNVTEKLAKAGFVAVAMDIYGDGKLTTDASQANEWMSQMLADQDKLMARCALILKDFCQLDNVDKDRIGVIGFCFGGKIALDMAREGFDIKAVATFHGNPMPKQPAQKDKFIAKVLVAHGEADSMVSMEAIEGLKQELDNAQVDYTIDVYEGAKHGFSNPHADERAKQNGVDLGYDEAATTISWDNMIEFMNKNL